jgi:hypothetical protein
LATILTQFLNKAWAALHGRCRQAFFWRDILRTPRIWRSFKCPWSFIVVIRQIQVPLSSSKNLQLFLPSGGVRQQHWWGSPSWLFSQSNFFCLKVYDWQFRCYDFYFRFKANLLLPRKLNSSWIFLLFSFKI